MDLQRKKYLAPSLTLTRQPLEGSSLKVEPSAGRGGRSRQVAGVSVTTETNMRSGETCLLKYGCSKISLQPHCASLFMEMIYELQIEVFQVRRARIKHRAGHTWPPGRGLPRPGFDDVTCLVCLVRRRCGCLSRSRVRRNSGPPSSPTGC